MHCQDSREERTFRVWLLSLLRNEVHIQNLTESLRDGYVLLRVLDTISPGCVAKMHQPPFKPLLKQPKSIENCNQVGLLRWFRRSTSLHSQKEGHQGGLVHWFRRRIAFLLLEKKCHQVNLLRWLRITAALLLQKNCNQVGLVH